MFVSNASTSPLNARGYDMAHLVRRIRPVAPLKIGEKTLLIGNIYRLYENCITDDKDKIVCDTYNCYQLKEILCNSELL